MKPRVLVVDDDANLRRVSALTLGNEGYEVHEASDGLDALSWLTNHSPHCVVTDLKMPRMDGLRLLNHIQNQWPTLPVVLVTAHGTVDTAVSALKDGAYDFLTKPVPTRDLRRVVRRAVEHASLQREVERLKLKVEKSPLGQATLWTQVVDVIQRVASTTATVLLTGESGTGKEILARYLHARSARTDKPYVAINCAAVPEHLLESELFGHGKGAFTGADKARIGRFQAAEGGTLLLDEIGEMPVGLQGKLLRALQEREVDPVGGDGPIPVDVRVVAATNAELEQKVADGTFRQDLYYRLAVLPIRIPALRERPGDATLLFAHFLSEFAERVVPVTAPASAFLEAQDWPGNVRELRNLAERCWLLGVGDEVQRTDVEQATGFVGSRPDGDEPPRAAGPLDPSNIELPQGNLPLWELEKAIIKKALDRFGGNKSAAARYLEIPRHRLIYRLEKYGLDDHE